MAQPDVKIRLTADDKTRAAFASANANLQKLQTGAAKLNSAFGALGVAVSVGGLAVFAKSGIDAADALNDMSQRTGVAVKTLADYKLAATLADTSLDDLAKGIQRLTLSQSQAEQGGKTQAEALKRLGITARDPQQAFEQLADAVANSNDPIKTNAALNDVLGRSYVNLLPLLQGGAQGLRDSAAASASFSEAMVKLAPDAAKFNDQLDELKLNAAGASAQILTRLVPSLAETSKRVGELLDEDKGIQALVRAFAGLGKLPFDLLIGDPFKIAGTAQDRIKELKSELNDLQRGLTSAQPGGGKSSVLMRKLFGTPEEIQRQITIKKNEIDALVKFGDQIYKPKPSPDDKPADGVVDISAAAKPIDKLSLYNDEMARNAKLIADETARIAGDYAFMSGVDIAQNPAGVAQAWRDAGLALKQDMLTPLEKFDNRLEYINELWRIGAIDIETYSRAMAAAFDENGPKVEKVKSLTEELGDAFKDTMDSAGDGIRNVGDLLDSLKNKVASVFAKKAGDYAANAITDFFFKPSANGNVFNSPALSAYSGSVVSSPTVFPFANGIGLMGEAGAEAILPLKRGRDGKLGVSMDGGGGVVVQNTYHIDARGADAGVEQRIRRAIDESEDRAVSRSVTQVQSMNQRGQLRLA